MDVAQAHERRRVLVGGRVGGGLGDVQGLAQPGGHVVPGRTRPRRGRHGRDRHRPPPCRSRAAKCAASGLRVLVPGEAEQHGGGPVRELGDESGKPQQAQYAVELGRVAVPHDQRDERPAVDGQPGRPGPRQQLAGRYDTARPGR